MLYIMPWPTFRFFQLIKCLIALLSKKQHTWENGLEDAWWFLHEDFIEDKNAGIVLEMIKWLVGSSKIRPSRTNWSYLSIKASLGPEFWHCFLMPWSHPIPLQILHLPQGWIWLLKQMWEGDSVAFLCSNCQGEGAEHEEIEGKGKEPGRGGCWGPLPILSQKWPKQLGGNISTLPAGKLPLGWPSTKVKLLAV